MGAGARGLRCSSQLGKAAATSRGLPWRIQGNPDGLLLPGGGSIRPPGQAPAGHEATSRWVIMHHGGRRVCQLPLPPATAQPQTLAPRPWACRSDSPPPRRRGRSWWRPTRLCWPGYSLGWETWVIRRP